MEFLFYKRNHWIDVLKAKKLRFLKKPLSQSQKPLKWGVFLKLSDFKQLKSFVRIGRNFKAKMALNNKEWNVKTYIHQSAMKISIIHSHHSLPFSSIKMLCSKILSLIIHSGYNLRFKKWLLDFALSKARAGEVKKINNWNLYHYWINLPSGN